MLFEESDEVKTTETVAEDEELKKALQDGPDVYLLCTVMVHRGGIFGGHYYGFVRDFETNCWLRCDDASVRQVIEVVTSCLLVKVLLSNSWSVFLNLLLVF